MADHDSIVSSDKLEAIADAIRAKTHKDNLMTLDDMPYEIASISGGGGGDTPECGVVPTSWSSNGFVLSADSYGDILPGLFYAGWQNASGYGYPSDTHDPNLPEDIDIGDVQDREFSGTQVYNYLKSLTFVTAPTVIGHQAFSDLYWLEIDELPEGVEVIEDYAFYQCANLQLHTIPSTVTDIGSNAFYNVNHPERFIPAYSEDNTYSIGDVTFVDGYGSNGLYTCIVAIDTPEAFDSEHWVEGNFPELIGTYDTGNIYQSGDIVYNSSTGHVCTCLQLLNGTITLIEGYFPDLQGEYDSTQQYTAGDIICRVEEASDGSLISICYLCKSPTYITGEWDSQYWEDINPDSGSVYFKLKTLRFLGTPDSISYNAFTDSGYNMILVPWNSGEGPGMDQYSATVVYGYNPEQ